MRSREVLGSFPRAVSELGVYKEGLGFSKILRKSAWRKAFDN